MAELNVQPKKQRSWWPWLLLALLALALIFFLLRGNRDSDADTNSTGVTADSTAMNTGPGTTADNDLNWDAISFDAPAATYEEITDNDINVRGNDDYAIYSVDETILFDTDKNTVKPDAAQKLKMVAASVGKRFAGGQVRIYGHTDAQGSTGYNKELAEQRAAAVQNWLVQNGNLSQDQVSLHAVGESQPVASNATAEGRQQNRRVEIVARRASNGG
jgi:outer membrane protein OmpA-like peptidoglycan-associated protein